MGRYRRQSSANRRTVDFTASGRSLMWHKNRSGPRTVPCGTPESTWTASDSSPSTTTFICLLVWIWIWISTLQGLSAYEQREKELGTLSGGVDSKLLNCILMMSGAVFLKSHSQEVT